MPNEPNQPREYDAVLGSQNSTPIDAAVLGGIAGVKSRLASPAIEVRIAGLSQALKYGENGLDLIFLQGLEDKSPKVKFAAYNLLKAQAEFKAKLKLNDFFYSFKFEVIRVDKQGIAISRRVKSAQSFIEDLGDSTAIDMVYIPGDTFQMGGSDDSRSVQRRVTIEPFFMGKYTVTQEQWKKVMEKGSYYFQGGK